MSTQAILAIQCLLHKRQETCQLQLSSPHCALGNPRQMPCILLGHAAAQYSVPEQRSWSLGDTFKLAVRSGIVCSSMIRLLVSGIHLKHVRRRAQQLETILHTKAISRSQCGLPIEKVDSTFAESTGTSAPKCWSQRCVWQTISSTTAASSPTETRLEVWSCGRRWTSRSRSC
jgi:hypothetical protein